jgi:hypothetical protein
VDTKGLLASKTVWGTVVMIIATALSFFKIDIGDQAGWVEAGMSLAGASLAIYGRIKAVKKISGVV